MMADIDLTEFLEDENPTQGWQPIGNSSAIFKGVLDGNGKKISGLWINRRNTDYVGLFGNTRYATIKDVKIVANGIVGNDSVGVLSGSDYAPTFSNVSISVSNDIVGNDHVGALSGSSSGGKYSNVSVAVSKIQGHSYVGGLVGSIYSSKLSGCTVTVTIIGSGDYVGGLIGMTYYSSTISNCHVNDSKITGNDRIGGACGGIMVGYNGLPMFDCYIHANITGCNKVGGICGENENNPNILSMTNCGYMGDISGISYVGGLIGFCTKTDPLNYYVSRDFLNGCFAVGSISATDDYVGGLIGYDKGYDKSSNFYHNNVSNCYFNGSVSGKDYIGGLMGWKKYGTTSNSYCSASVVGNRYVGGLIGYNNESSTLKTSIAINTRVVATEGDVNRLVGYNNGSIASVGSSEENKSYNRTIVISQGVAKDIEDDAMNGTGVSMTTLKLKATYVAMGWDFTKTWDIQETECLPYMKWQTAPPVITSSVNSGTTVISGKCVDDGIVTLEMDGVKQQTVSNSQTFSFDVSPLLAGHEIRVSAKAEGKEQSYYTTETVSFIGKGTETDPYQIYTAAELAYVYLKGYYKQMNDIDLTEYINQFSPSEGWQSIGRDGGEIIHYDGGGHKVTGLWCNSTRDNTGLFSCFANGEIKNLTVETATNKQVKGGKNTGIIIGKMVNGSLVNCKVSGTVADGTPVGGMVGLFEGGTIYNCQANVIINATLPNSYIGGIVGEFTSGTIEKCVTNGKVTATGEASYVGGLAGETKAGTIDQCFTEGTLTAKGNSSYVGGIAGMNVATLKNSYSTANVTSSYNAAGIVAYNYGLVDKCYAVGNLYSKNYAAGVVGYNDGSSAVVSNCAAMNNKIEITYESQQGGGYGQRIIGGIKNGAPAPEMNNYALKTMLVSLNDVPQRVYDDIMNGTSKTVAELTAEVTYQGLDWDFENIWKISEGTSYPYLDGATPVNPNPGDDDPNGINTIENKQLNINNIYTPSGQSIEKLQRGINIIRSSNGSTRKVLIK